ncbi:MAG: GntR family transcriptional regulator [Betaproteobacteria bacterium]|nr:GntR family transcriptional regulator [Betaproteobacteria bacterium]
MATPSPTSPASLFSVTTGSGEPIYRQLVDQVRRLVAGGQLAAGDELPSVRETAQALAVNPMTVSKAYSQLEAAGVLERRRGVGMVVAAQHTRAQTKTERVDLLRPTLERAAAEAAQLEIDPVTAMALFEKILKGKR